MRRLILVLAGVLVLALAGAPAAGANHKWGKYHWARASASQTVNLVYSEGAGVSNWSPADVRADWNAFAPVVKGAKAVQISTGSSGVDVTVQSGNYGATGWVGVAQIGIGTRNHIVSGRIRLNTYYPISSSQRRSTYCMEAGHVFGLGHNNEGKRGGLPDDTCMNENRWEVSPNGHDTQQLAATYNHGDGFSTFRKHRRQPHSFVTIHETSLHEARSSR